MEVSILGAGNAGHALTAHLTKIGHEIKFFEMPNYRDNIAAAKLRGGIKVTGLTNNKTEFVRIKNITTDIKEAVYQSKVIVIAAPSFAHEVLIRHFAKYLDDGQIVVFPAGKLVSLLFLKVLKDLNINKNIIVGEMASLPYACRLQNPGQVNITSIKNKLKFSTCPANKNYESLKILKELFPQLYPGKNIFDLISCAPILHPISTLLNSSRIEYMGPYKTSYYDVTPSVGRLMDLADKERVSVCSKFGIKADSCKKFLYEHYGATGDNMYDVLHNCITYKNQTSPDSLKFRYVTEDIPYGMVTISSLGKMAGIFTPVIDTIINLASFINNENYWKIGRTVEKLGISEFSIEQIIKFVNNGKIK